MKSKLFSVRVVAAALAAITLIAAAKPVSVLSDLAGRYTYRFKNGDIEGNRYRSTDVVQIFPLDKNRAMISFELNFFNGHSCTLSGEARLEGSRLVYRDEPAEPSGQPQCALSIWRNRTDLHWEDGGTCHSYCGARGGFVNGKMSVRTRRILKTPPPKPLP